MAGDRATFDSFAGVEVSLPDGRTLTCEVLPLHRGLHWLRMLHSAERGDSKAIYQIIEEFPPEVGISEDERLFPFEVFDLVRRFLSHRRTPMEPKTKTPPPPTQNAASGVAETNSTTGGTT